MESQIVVRRLKSLSMMMDSHSGRFPPSLQDLAVVVYLRSRNLPGLSMLYTFADDHLPNQSTSIDQGHLNVAAVLLPLQMF